ncbi:MAG: AbrB/MazE/SpoVT family DNA-binding domain-containing protein, partial [Clostridiales bacterium]|nr:AbrB/MazE/SpoVT family DNA-binding domain-containing protein [Clostridiales bacterium]
MITEFRKKSQITIPKEVVLKLGLKEGDKLEIIESDGVISIIPVVVHSKKYLAELKKEIMDIKAKINSGDHLVFDNVDDLFKQLDFE